MAATAIEIRAIRDDGVKDDSSRGTKADPLKWVKLSRAVTSAPKSFIRSSDRYKIRRGVLASVVDSSNSFY